MDKSGRVIAIDILKGILIIFVIVGHYEGLNINIKNIIFWFHMPLFFIINGFFIIKQNCITKQWLKQKTLKYMVPYFSYFLLITLIIERNCSVKNTLNFLYGGRAYEGVFWFIPCLFITYMVFNYIIYKLSHPLIIISIMGILANLESNYFIPKDGNYLNWGYIYKFPLNVDVCFIAIVYVALGFYLKEYIYKHINKINIYFLLFSLFVFFSLVLMYLGGKFSYSFDMKLSHYYNLIFNLTIPILAGYILVALSILLNQLYVGKLLAFIGENTLAIMYLHIPLNNYFTSKLNYGIYGYVFIGVFLPIVFCHICTKHRYLKFLFNGV